MPPAAPRKPHVSLKRMHGWATQCLRITEKYAGESRSLEAAATTVVPAARRFEYHYGLHRDAADGTMLRLAREQVRILRQAVRDWLALVRRDLPDTTLPTCGTRAVPGKVLAAAKKLIEVLQDARDESPLPYTDSALTELADLFAMAQGYWMVAEGEQMLLEQCRQRVREAAVALQTELVTFRRVLRTLLGHRHPDYQRLRTKPGRGGSKCKQRRAEAEGGGARRRRAG